MELEGVLQSNPQREVFKCFPSPFLSFPGLSPISSAPLLVDACPPAAMWPAGFPSIPGDSPSLFGRTLEHISIKLKAGFRVKQKKNCQAERKKKKKKAVIIIVFTALEAEAENCQCFIDNLHLCERGPGIVVAHGVIIPGKLLLCYLGNCCLRKMQVICSM